LIREPRRTLRLPPTARAPALTVYFEEEPERDEARRIAANIA
jgi:hypothetical protein